MKSGAASPGVGLGNILMMPQSWCRNSVMPVLVWDWDILMLPQSQCAGLGGFGNVLVLV